MRYERGPRPYHVGRMAVINRAPQDRLDEPVAPCLSCGQSFPVHRLMRQRCPACWEEGGHG